MNKIELFVFLQASALLFACKPSEKISVSNVKDMKESTDRSFIYSLPQTVFDITVTAKEIVVIPGIYAEYASEYLGIKNAPLQEESIWRVSGVKMGVHHEADPDFVYSLYGKGNVFLSPVFTRLVNDSMILLDNNFAGGRIFYNSVSAKLDEKYIPEPVLGNNFLFDDSEMPGDPTPLDEIRDMSVRDKAREAANMIMRIKRRKAGLSTATYEYIPEAFALGEAIDELARMEKEYLALFTGDTIVNEHSRTFHFVPGNLHDPERSVLFSFSDQDGFAGGTSAVKPFILQLENGNKTLGLEASAPPRAGRNLDVITYRVPDIAYIKLLYGEEVLVDAFVPVFQYGRVITANPW